MINDADISSAFLDDENFESQKPFYQFMQKALTPKIKQFLSDYYGESFYNLHPDTYLLINKTISDAFIFAVQIPDILYIHRTITDSDKFDEALANFTPPKTPVVWKNYENWFDRDFQDDDEEDNTFLEDSHLVDLTPDQQKAKQIINQVNELTENTQNFAHFMKSGYEILLKEARLFLENTSSFDLSILSPKGFDALHEQLDSVLNILLEQLEAVICREQ